MTSAEDFDRLAALETDECVIWPRARGGQRGYGQVHFPGRRNTYAHSEALLRRTPRPFPGAQALHGPCNNPACMNYRHLHWGTQSENLLDRRRDGTVRVGQKLWPGIVDRIRVEHAQGASQHELGRRWGVAQPTIGDIVRQEAWT